MSVDAVKHYDWSRIVVYDPYQCIGCRDLPSVSQCNAGTYVCVSVF